jgi:hypothetical protein
MAIGAAVIAPQMADIRQLHSKSVVQDRAIQSNAVMLGRLEERLAGRIEVLTKQTVRAREEIDWVWDLLHSRFGYRDGERGRKDPNLKE